MTLQNIESAAVQEAQRRAKRAEQSRLCRARKKARLAGLEKTENVYEVAKKLADSFIDVAKATGEPVVVATQKPVETSHAMTDVERRARRAEQSRQCRARKRSAGFRITEKPIKKMPAVNFRNAQAEFLSKVGRDFDEYYQTFFPKLLWFVSKIVGADTNQDETAEDVTVRAFTRALENIHKYDPKFEFSTWLFTIARKMSLQVLKDRKRVVRIGDEDDEDGQKSLVTLQSLTTDDTESDSAEPCIKTKMKAKLILECISQLPEKQREIIILRELHDLTYTQISVKLGLHLSTVKNQIRQSRITIRNKVADKFAYLDENY